MKVFYRVVLTWAMIAFIGFLFADFIVLPFFAGHFKGTVSVPSVIKMPSEQARIIIEREGLICMVDSNAEFSPEIKAGLVLKQRPEYETKVKKGRRVWVTVSKGLESIRLPRLKGGSLRQGEILLQQSGLKLGSVIEVKKKGIPNGVVFKTAPSAGSPVETGSSVTVFVSSNTGNQAKKTVINMSGMSFSRAKAVVTASGMTVGGVTYQHRDNMLPNTVISHTPAAGAPLKSGKPVNFLISQ